MGLILIRGIFTSGRRRWKRSLKTKMRTWPLMVALKKAEGDKGQGMQWPLQGGNEEEMETTSHLQNGMQP